MPIASTLHARLACASQWAYSVTADGTLAAAAPYDSAVGFVTPPLAFVSGSRDIDACLVGRNDDGIIVAFRGTLPAGGSNRRQTLEDWLQNLDAGLVHRTGQPGQVHEGFARSLDRLWPELSGAVKGLLAAGPARVHVTGHSKGGAVAPLAAMRLLSEGIVKKADIDVCTFAAPRSGNKIFAEGYMAGVNSAIRYEYADDFVPHVAPSFFFRHALSKIERLKKLRGVGYAPCGDLRFIDWDGRILPGSMSVRLRRVWRMTRLVAQLGFDKIVDDHSVGHGSGTLRALWPDGGGR